MVGVQKQKSLAFCTKIWSGSQNFYNSYCLWFTFGQISARSKTRRNRKYILDCFYLSTQVYLDKQFVLQDGRPYGSFFLTKRSICCFIFGVLGLPHCRNMRPAPLLNGLNFNTEVFFVFLRQGRPGNDDGYIRFECVFKIHTGIILNYISGSFHYLYRMFLGDFCN